LLLAWAYLKGLGAPSTVSSATLDAKSGTLTSAEHCKIDQITSQNGVLRFQRLDESSPLPIPADSSSALSIAPILDDLSRYILTVTGLESPHYTLSIDGEQAGEFTREQLAAGINLTGLPGPITKQGQDLWAKVAGLNDNLVNRWIRVRLYQPQFPDWVKAPLSLDTESRAALEAARKTELDRMDLLTHDAEQEIDLLRQPKSHVFELRPTNPTP
jgi:hypothetical protein